ncbi:hypothetical protein ACO0LB_17180 [Undibacterium sp. SXout7W]|uniref:hypothetical protein n=1 Tax=Undibacterium sp. SXout7W TaxID=3413049 RepID=UPI003BF3D76F
MISAYTPLFSITINHSYFADNLGYPLKLSPDNACMDLLARYQLAFRPFPKGGGATIYCNNLAILRSFNLLDGLSFDLSCDDIALINYTQIDTTPLSKGGTGPSLNDSLFYCDNLGSTSTTDTPDTLNTLSTPGAISSITKAATPPTAENNCLQPAFGLSALETQPKQFLYVFDTPLTSARLTVTDNLCNAIVWAAITPDQPVPSYLINLTGLPDGRYQLYADGNLLLSFYALDIPNASPWGKITIYLGGPAQVPYLANKGNTNYTLSSTGDITLINYQMKLEHRQTIWRYKIFSSQNNYGSNWQVSASTTKNASANQEFNTGNNNFTFTYAAGTTEQPWVYQSAVVDAAGLNGELLNLLQTPKGMSFVLEPIAATHANGAHIQTTASSVNLPYAQGNLLVLPDNDNTTINYSDIYVYL